MASTGTPNWSTPTWTLAEGRAKVVDVRRRHPAQRHAGAGSEQAFTDTVDAGQYVNLAVEIDGRRHTRCYSPANAEGAAHLELTIGQHDGGLVSTYLHEHARRGMVVGLTGVGGDFVLPAHRPRRILFVSGGSGITPVMAMLRTLVDEGHAGEIAFVHYARNRAEACYHDELAALPGVRVLHGYTRSTGGDLDGRFGAEHLAAAMPEPDAVFVCGPAALVDAVREHCADAHSESFVPPTLDLPAQPSGGRVDVRRQRYRGHRRRPLAARAGGVGRTEPRKADAGWASATPAPAAKPAASCAT